MNAVVTAGGLVDPAYAQAAGTLVKALAPVRGVTMLDRILEALRGAGVERIAVVGGPEVRAACAGRVEKLIDDAGSGSGNVERALHAWPGSHEPMLYATSDMPYASAEAIADFAARSPDGHLCIALCEYEAFAARFRGAPEGFGIRLRGERVVNGGLFMLPGDAGARSVAAVAMRFFDARKHPWRMVRLVDPMAAMRFAFGRLSIAHLEAEARRIVGLPAHAVRGCAPELGYDADALEEYRYACEVD